MPREEERLIRLKQQYSKEAIDLAMQGRWQEAVTRNQELIENFPDDAEAYNRLGRAYMELGNYAQAREAYARTAEIDPYNAIAKKNLQRLSYLKEQVSAEVEMDKVEPHNFIEEIGQTGVVNLYDLAPREIQAKMVAGDKVHLKVEGVSLLAENGRGEYLGRVEPRHAQRIARLMLGGNKYTAAVVGATKDNMTVIIRETYQAPSQVGRLSFPPKGLDEVRPYVSDKLFKVEDDEDDNDKSGYTIIGGDEIEVFPEELMDADDTGSDEE